MHCKRCDYPLWDLASRVCPECGLGFSPVDYEFVVNSVRFMCPHCRQAYYGTGDKGHLVPRRFVCVKCAQMVDESEMVMLPTMGVSEVQTVGGVVAWRERAKRGRVAAFFAAIGQSAFVPHRLARYCGQTVNAWEACWFGLLVTTVSALAGFGWCGGLLSFSQSQRLGMQGGTWDLAALALQGAMWVIAPVVGLSVFGAVWMGVAQLVLSVGRPVRVEAAKTAECFGYAWGSCFLMAVPCFGVHLSPLALIWVAVSAIVQLHVRHNVGVGRVVWAVLTFPLAVLVLLIGGIVLASSL